MAPSIEDLERKIGRGVVPGDCLKTYGGDLQEVTSSPSISPNHTGVKIPGRTGEGNEGNAMRDLDLYEDIIPVEHNEPRIARTPAEIKSRFDQIGKTIEENRVYIYHGGNDRVQEPESVRIEDQLRAKRNELRWLLGESIGITDGVE